MVFMIVGFVVISILAVALGYKSIIKICCELRAEGRTVAAVILFLVTTVQIVLTVWMIFR